MALTDKADHSRAFIAALLSYVLMTTSNFSPDNFPYDGGVDHW